MYAAVMNAARSKVVFQINHDDDLAPLTRQLPAGALDPRLVKRWTTKVVGYDREETVTRTTGTSSQAGTAQTSTRSKGAGRSRKVRGVDDGAEPDIVESEDEGDGSAEGRSQLDGESYSETIGVQLVPVMGEEVAEYVSLEEQRVMFEQIVNGLDKRHAMVRLVSMRIPVALRTLEVPPAWVSDAEVDAYLQERFRSLPFALPLAEAVERAERREREFVQNITAMAGAAESPTARRKVVTSKATVVKSQQSKSRDEVKPFAGEAQF